MAETVLIDARRFRARMVKLGMMIESSEIAKVAGQDILAWVADNFQSQGRAPGGPGGWKPLKEATIARRRTGPGVGTAKILQDTGKLKQSFVPGLPDNVFRQYAGRGIDVGTTLHYAPYHEFGTRHIPQRKMLPRRDVAQRIAAQSIEAIIRVRTAQI